jgi:hypothetical protein
MRVFIVFVVVLSGFLQMSGRVLEACGAKFIVTMKSPRALLAQRATRPATILLYQHTEDVGVVEFIGELRNVKAEATRSRSSRVKPLFGRRPPVRSSTS